MHREPKTGGQHRGARAGMVRRSSPAKEWRGGDVNGQNGLAEEVPELGGGGCVAGEAAACADYGDGLGGGVAVLRHCYGVVGW